MPLCSTDPYENQLFSVQICDRQKLLYFQRSPNPILGGFCVQPSFRQGDVAVNSQKMTLPRFRARRFAAARSDA
jgi:hypothetical protein